MSYDYSSQIEHDKLVEEIKGYWTSNGWRLQTLMNKSTRELIGIRNSMRKRMLSTPKLIHKSVKSVAQYKQISLFD